MTCIELNKWVAGISIGIFAISFVVAKFYCGSEGSFKNVLKKTILFTVIFVILFWLGGYFFLVDDKPKTQFKEYRFTNGGVGVLILQFKGDSNNSLQRDLISTLGEMLKKQIHIDIHGCEELVDINIGLSQGHQKAREIGIKYNASLVVWGNRIGKNKIHFRITSVNPKFKNMIRTDFSSKAKFITEAELPYELINEPVTLVEFLSGSYHYERKEYLLAINYFEKISGYENNSTVNVNGIHNNLGRCHLFYALDNLPEDHFHYNQAIHYFSKVIEKAPNFIDAYFTRAGAHYQKGDFLDAINDLSEIIKKDSGSPKAFQLRGDSYYKIGKCNLSIKDHTKTIELNPEDERSYFSRGTVHLKLNEYKKAINDFNDAIRINPKNEYSFAKLGYLFDKLGDLDQAIANYSIAIKLNPSKKMDFLPFRAHIYYKKKLHDQAIEDYNLILIEDPKNEEALFNRGVSYIESGQYQKAKADFEKTITINPARNEAHINLNYCQYMMDFVQNFY